MSRVLAYVALGLLMACAGRAEEPKLSLPAHPSPAGEKPAPAPSALAPDAATAPTAPKGIRLTGQTAARRVSHVAATGAGLVKEVRVQAGDLVKEGQVIVVLDRRDVELRKAQADAAVELARVRVGAARIEKERASRLSKDSAISGVALDGANAGYALAEAGLRAAEVGVAMAQKALDDTEIRAPFDGLVVRTLKTEGEWVSTMPPAPVVQLAEAAVLELHLSAPERYVQRIRPGDPVHVRFDAVDSEVEAQVARIVPLVDPRTGAFTVIAEISNPDGRLSAGLFAEARVMPAPPAVEPPAAPAKLKGDAAP